MKPEILTLQLPLPPSVNALFATNFGTKRRFKSKRYEMWQANATEAVWKQHGGRLPMLTGNIFATYVLGRPDKRRRDCENYSKAISDFLVEHQVIADDSLIDMLCIGWTDEHPGIVKVKISNVIKMGEAA